MLPIVSTTSVRSISFLPYRYRRLTQTIVGGICAISLLVGAQTAALAYSPDHLEIDPNIPGAIVASTSSPSDLQLKVSAQTETLPSSSSGATQSAAVSAPSNSVSTGPIAAILKAPAYSQFDGSIWAESNCGPTALSMALGALGVNVDQLSLRKLANLQMHLADPNNGTTWESLAAAAQQSGVSVGNLYGGSRYNLWSVDDLKNQISQGHPVLLLVRYRGLPGHQTSAYYGDHYVVALGIDRNGNIVYNDPATHPGGSVSQTMTPEQLLNAWSTTRVGLVRTAMALYK